MLRCYCHPLFYAGKNPLLLFGPACVLAAEATWVVVLLRRWKDGLSRPKTESMLALLDLTAGLGLARLLTE